LNPGRSAILKWKINMRCPKCKREMRKEWHGWDCDACEMFFTDMILKEVYECEEKKPEKEH